ncbi:hypothetical protein PoB_003523500 [Plakobranchus ocellatus]|uniref:Uncharacterized protein n=1 Tax=Plakobranchus ocellatus TaxID=259542 RepID=A0AAV4APD3_9GAST|nr:hypothetical protein PoB_003523500 [Plakobranchus ocellatus]
MSYCNISSSWSIKDEEKNSMANIGEVHVHSLVANTKTKIDLKFTNESSTFVVTIYTLGPKFNHSALKTSNVVDQFASYHFRCLRSAKLFVSKRNEELTGLRYSVCSKAPPVRPICFKVPPVRLTLLLGSTGQTQSSLRLHRSDSVCSKVPPVRLTPLLLSSTGQTQSALRLHQSDPSALRFHQSDSLFSY